MTRFIKNNIYIISGLLFGTLIIPLGYWTELGKGLVVFTNSLIGISAAITAWWAYKTFAFKERIDEHKKIYEGLKNAELAYKNRFGSHYNLIKILLSNATTSEDRLVYEQQLRFIELEHKTSEDFLNDLFYSPFVSDDLNIQLLLLIRTKEFKNNLEVQDAFHKVKLIHKNSFILKT